MNTVVKIALVEDWPDLFEQATAIINNLDNHFIVGVKFDEKYLKLTILGNCDTNLPDALGKHFTINIC